jgi:hypothetical protein
MQEEVTVSTREWGMTHVTRSVLAGIQPCAHPGDDVDDVAADMPLLYMETKIKEVGSDLQAGVQEILKGRDQTLSRCMTAAQAWSARRNKQGARHAMTVTGHTSNSPLCVTKSSGLIGVSCCSMSPSKRGCAASVPEAGVCMRCRLVGRASLAGSWAIQDLGTAGEQRALLERSHRQYDRQ